jgi:hypothetical protein
VGNVYGKVNLEDKSAKEDNIKMNLIQIERRSGSCPVAGFGMSGVEPSGSAATVIVNVNIIKIIRREEI